MRRLGAMALAGALLVACGGDGGEPGASPTSATGPTTTSSAGGPTSTTGAPAPSPDGGAPGTTVGGSGPVTTLGSSRPLDPGGVGGLAAALLRPGNGNRIVVEVRAQADAAPSSGTLDHLTRVLRDASGKTVALDGIDGLAGGGRAWTAAQIVAVADQAAQHGQGGAQVVVRLLFLHGTFEGDDSVLGVAVRGDVAAVFVDSVASAAGLLVSPRVVEDAVTMHELGHLLGLVDLAVDTGRDDPDHPGHSRNRDSVMYWAVESDVIGQLLDGGIPNEFDAQDRADLARIRAG